ncbi:MULTISPECIES: DUF2164 domain-containing protein [Vibrio]|uniref:DUF2164 domain-containing protein n=1 Tax=Vibrio diazotrophicus TaxID=685 RepID=A0A329E0C5_VIBDI|nr:DUF2164 domain-containing protein [Vibrio diazotrophicus]MCZ4373171.1 DUF2164 domain-containing protein [Vibrio diazotrophicus]PNH81958.1 DUF2164 domain-containing protein [Vibrio diazotrophicus]PNH89412.1 DUF2164 domain-containing protein [Vibrio diazotrophicus]PNH95484.1 DUF2164 domain-containing protein [Vibrio diazotrophicus]PNH99672.1 DUF2164 domain-containing protein [Vibrio diazotrophicus]
MSDIEFTQQQKEGLTEALQKYCADELGIELEQFDAWFLLEFVTNKIGPVYYNKGLSDAQSVIERKMLDIADELYQIEKESEF